MKDHSITTFLRAAGAPEEGAGLLEDAWSAIFAELNIDEQATFGSIHVGKDASKPFAYTQRGDGSGANLCLELAEGRIELNLVGWKMDQARAMKGWLATYSAEKAIRDFPDHEVVVYLRKAHVASPEARPYWQSEMFEVVARWPTADYETWRLANVTMTDYGAGTAFAYHVRRSWDPAGLEASPDPLGALVAEVRRFIPLLREINGVALG